MDLSIIIPVYNAAPLLDRCLDSVFNQTTQYNYEVILVDDGSTDNSVEIIKSRNEKNILFYQQKNAGPSVARNKGIELANGEFLAFLDADDYWNDGYIEQTVSFLLNHKECIAVTVGQKHIAIGKQPLYWPILSNKIPFIINDFYSFWASYQHVGTCSTTMRRDIVKKSKGQRTDLRVTEDWEFWFYLASFGKWGMIPNTLYVSDGGDVTRKEGWLKKMQIRWNNAPSVEEWQTRLIGRIDLNSESYKKAIGIIARNLCYCQLLSGRKELSRNEAIKYGDYFTKDAIGRLMNMAKYSKLTWNMLVAFLRYREYNRK